MDMMEQYKNEISQIHAPADLIRRTKLAVRNEERRIHKEAAQGGPVVYRSERRGHKLHKWALTVSAAAVFALLFCVSYDMLGNRVGKTKMSGSSGTMSGEADAGMIEDAAQSSGVDTGMEEDGMQPLGAEAGGIEDGIQFSGVDAGAETEDLAKPDMPDQMSDSAEGTMEMAEDTAGAMVQGNELSAVKEPVEKKNSAMDRAASLSITEVDELPSFYHNPDTERIVHNGKAFYVSGGQNNEWSAYVRVNGKRYVIVCENGEVTDQENFVRKAFELLVETAEGVE